MNRTRLKVLYHNETIHVYDDEVTSMNERNPTIHNQNITGTGFISTEALEGMVSKKTLTRREFFLGGAGVILSLALGCKSSEKREDQTERSDGLSAEDIFNNQEEYYHKVQQENDPNNYFRFLRIKEKECIVPKDILCAFASAMNYKRELLGCYITQSYRMNVNIFRERLTALSVSPEKRQFYERLFMTRDAIILSDTLLKSQIFEKALPHERFHKLLHHLPLDQYLRMNAVANIIVSKINKEWQPKKSRIYIEEAIRSWQEFYTYLAAGEFKDTVAEEELKEERDVYKIFLKIKKQSQLGKDTTPVK